ncbi:tetrahydrofolate dehydrogenase/cyclohydrolase catalytic domain-containing protein [Rickettsia endosymbiont of Halotydeus destructor]|uniref:tetrahydrofolate dehydrogenase/cyclohydrolase catalytic domain-containing protein n=1 Tax=Rickettsia endosymbiont of Halotydeus destructor TaxID=2996754 RepID=UPI003BAE2A20
MTNIIDGKFLASKILAELKLEIEVVKNKTGISPKLAIILIGNNPASTIYVQNKIKTATKIAIDTLQLNLPTTINTDELIKKINELNQDTSISGIIVQLPLPSHIDKDSILSAVAPHKDVDGFHPLNVGYLHSGLNIGFIPCTALGCLEVIKHYEKNLIGKNAMIVGRSNIVGKPLAALLLKENCTVTICHSQTQKLSSITSKADIVVAAIGSPLHLTTEYFNSNALVIDVGITRLLNNKIVGDVDFENVKDKVKYITPVPGGIGPMTIAFLLKNTVKAMKQQHTTI